MKKCKFCINGDCTRLSTYCDKVEICFIKDILIENELLTNKLKEIEKLCKDNTKVS